MARPGVEIRGKAGMIANLYRARTGIVKEIRRVNARTAQETCDLAQQLAPVDTGNLRESITSELSPDGLVFSVYHDPAHYADGQNYGVFMELGFRHAASGEFIIRPHLFPAFESTKRRYAAEVSAAVRNAIRSIR